MTLRQYLTTDDLTATVLQDFNCSGYVDQANRHIGYLAASMGVDADDVPVNVTGLLLEYGAAYASRLAVQDKIGANNIDVGETDKYIVLYEVYTKEVERLRKYITPEILKDEADEPRETVPSTLIYRG